MRPTRLATVVVLVVLMVARIAGADFSFSEEERQQNQQHEKKKQGQRAAAAVTLDAKCRAKLAKLKTMIIVAEHVGGGYRTRQDNYDPHFSVLSGDLQRLGVRVYSRGEIQAQIAQAEINAYFKNDADGALGAAKKLGPNLVLRASIGSRSSYNEFMGLDEVAVSIALSLTHSSGKIISQASAGADSYSGSDTLGMALRLLNEQAPGAVNKLYLDFCRARDAAPPAEPAADDTDAEVP